MQKIMNTLRKVTRGEDLKEKFSKIIEYLQKEIQVVKENRETYYSVLGEIKESLKDTDRDDVTQSYKQSIEQLEQQVSLL